MSEASAVAIRLGEARYRAGAWAEAAAIFARVAEHDPEDSAALRLLGLCRLRLGRLWLLRKAQVREKNAREKNARKRPPHRSVISHYFLPYPLRGTNNSPRGREMPRVEHITAFRATSTKLLFTKQIRLITEVQLRSCIQYLNL